LPVTDSQPAPRAPKSNRRKRSRRARGRSTQPAPSRAPVVVAIALATLALAAGGFVVYDGYVKARVGDGAGDGGDSTAARLAALESLGSKLNAQVETAAAGEARLAAQLTAIDARLGTVESTAGAADARAQALAGELQAEAAARRAATRELTESVAALRAESAKRGNQDAWRVAEAEHLLALANQRLRLGGDGALARRALALADDRLRQVADPALAAVRAQIAADTVALDQTARVDVAGTMYQLAALARAAEALPLAGEVLTTVAAGDSTGDSTATDSTVTDSTVTGDSTAAAAGGWVAAGKELLADLGELVQVETIDADARPALPAEARALIRANARLILEAAQVAFLRGEDALYAERMRAAGAWVAAHFAASNAARDWRRQLDELAQVSPTVAWPDIGRSLQALRAATGR